MIPQLVSYQRSEDIAIILELILQATILGVNPNSRRYLVKRCIEQLRNRWTLDASIEYRSFVMG